MSILQVRTLYAINKTKPRAKSPGKLFKERGDIMGKHTPNLIEQIAAIQTENQQLKDSLNDYKKVSEIIIKNELGVDLKTAKKALSKGDDSHQCGSIFEEKIFDYFGIKSVEDIEDFLQIMLTPSSLNHFKKERQKKEVEAAQQDS